MSEKGMSEEQKFEQRLLDRGLTAPRVTLKDVENNIAQEYYFTAADGIVGASSGPEEFPEELCRYTFCVLRLKNGFVLHGENACVSAENFDPEIAKELAKKDAMNKIWPLMGYELKTRLSELK